MTEQPTTTRRDPLPTRVRRRLGLTAALTAGTVRRRDSLAVVAGVGVGYLLVFLYMIQDLHLGSGSGLSVTLASDPLRTMFESAPGTLMGRPIALLELGVATWEFSPINTTIGLTLAVLVGVNLGLSYLAVTQPKKCGFGASSGLFASVPALLAGSACCAPVVLIILGVQATATLMTVFALMLPVGIVLLLGSLVYLAGKVDPTAVR